MIGTITATMLYNLVLCPHRVALDLFGDREKRDPISPFVQLLWERGQVFEKEVIGKMEIPFTDLRSFAGAEKERLTREAMKRGDALIYAGRICADNLIGEPDILRKEGSGYVSGDIKSGAGMEGADEEDEEKPKKHYGVQLALYTDILERLGLAGCRRTFVWDIHGEEALYDLDAPLGRRKRDSLWDLYGRCLESATSIISRSEETLPALTAACKRCHWRSSCEEEAAASQDLTLIPELGRVTRDALSARIRNVPELARADLSALIRGKKTVFPRIGTETLRKFRDRAALLVRPGARPYRKKPYVLPSHDLEVFFDVETDPMRDICYLHGFLERRGGSERYIPFFAASPSSEDEEKAFADAYAYLQACLPCTLYYYASCEKTIWRRLQKRYPSIATKEQVDALFSAAETVDLYLDVIRPCTEWPTHDYSIKTLASYAGFTWRDVDPSGASSIEWYNRWVETGDERMRRRILEYNEDDCIATRVLVEELRRFGGADQEKAGGQG